MIRRTGRGMKHRAFLRGVWKRTVPLRARNRVTFNSLRRDLAAGKAKVFPNGIAFWNREERHAKKKTA